MTQLAADSEAARHVRRSIALTLVVCGLVAGCRRDEVTHFRVSKRSDATPLRIVPASPVGMEVAAPSAPANGIRWTLPKGWNATMIGGMRYATLRPPGAGRVDVSVVTLPGPAGLLVPVSSGTATGGGCFPPWS